MRRRDHTALLVGLTLASVVRWAMAAPPPQMLLRARMSNLIEIALKPGVNNTRFAGTGRHAQILDLVHWSPAGTGVYSTYCVLERGDTGLPTRPWVVVPISQNRDERSECEEDWPWDGENSHKTVRFFNGRYDDQPVTLMIISDRNGGHGKPARAPATFFDPEYTSISIFRLQRSSSDDGFPDADHFVLLAQIQSAREYTSADQALSDELAVPMPKGQ